MNGTLWVDDIKSLLVSRRTAYSIAIMAVLATIVAVVVAFSPEGLKEALRAAAPASSGVFEYLWIEDVLDKLLIITFVSFGAFAICDLEDDRMMELVVSRPHSRFEFISRRVIASMTVLIIVFVGGSAIVSVIGSAIVGGMDAGLFLLHQILVLPMCLFVFSLTLFLSVPLRTTAPTVVTSFAIALALSFAYSLLIMTGDPTPSPLNPLALGYRILLDLPIDAATSIALAFSGIFLIAGAVWFTRRDL